MAEQIQQNENIEDDEFGEVKKYNENKDTIDKIKSFIEFMEDNNLCIIDREILDNGEMLKKVSKDFSALTNVSDLLESLSSINIEELIFNYFEINKEELDKQQTEVYKQLTDMKQNKNNKQNKDKQNNSNNQNNNSNMQRAYFNL